MFRGIKWNPNGGLVLIIILCCAVFPGCNEKTEIPKVKLVDGAGNMTADKTADFGGNPSQSFKPVRSGTAVAIRLLIEGRENPRDLLLLFRKADLNGYPTGKVLASGLTTIPVAENHEAGWHEVTFDHPVSISHETIYALELIPSTPHSGYGYFEYALSNKDKYPAGRLHTRSPSRRVPEDDGTDLCFQLILEVSSSESGTPVANIDTPASMANTLPPAPAEQQATKKEANPELDRMLRFMRLNRLDLSGYSGQWLRIWTNNDGHPGESIEDRIIPDGKFDIYYGHSDDGYPIFHMIELDSSGGTRHLPGIGRTHYYTDISLEHAKGKSLLIGKEYSGKNNFWLRLDPPSEKPD